MDAEVVAGLHRYIDSMAAGTDLGTSSVKLERELKELDLAQIGHFFLTYLAESNHNSWDGFGIEHMLGIEALFADMRLALAPGEVPPPNGSLHLSFGGKVHWDGLGFRH